MYVAGAQPGWLPPMPMDSGRLPREHRQSDRCGLSSRMWHRANSVSHALQADKFVRWYTFRCPVIALYSCIFFPNIPDLCAGNCCH